MKHIFFAILLLFFAAPVFGQTLYTTGVTFCAGVPVHNPGTTGAKWALDTTTWNLYVRSYGTTWTLIGNNWIQNISGCSAPAYTPTKHQSKVVINACDPPELYIWDGAAWDQIGGAAGITGTGLANRLAYWTTSGAVGYGSAFRVDTTNRRIGIGAVPTANLDILTTSTAVDEIILRGDVDGIGFRLNNTGTGGGNWVMNVLKTSSATSTSPAGAFTFRGTTTGGDVLTLTGSVIRAQQGIEITSPTLTPSLRIQNQNAGGANMVFSGIATGTASTGSPAGSITLRSTSAGLNLVNFLSAGGMRTRGAGTTSAGWSLEATNSLDSVILHARNDRRVGINTATPDVSLDAGDNTDAIKIPSGTTAQEPAVNNTLRFNSDRESLDARENGVMFRLTSSKTPSIAAGAAAGTGPTIAVAGNDLSMKVTLTAGTSSTTGALFTVTYASSMDAGVTNYPVFSCADVDCTGLNLYVSAESNTAFTISTQNAPTDDVQYIINIHIGQ